MALHVREQTCGKSVNEISLTHRNSLRWRIRFFEKVGFELRVKKWKVIEGDSSV